MDAIALFAYALIEKDRVDWSEHMASISGALPDQGQIEDWFRSKPDSYFSSIEDLADRWFFGFAVNLLRGHIEDEKKKAIAEALGNLGKFWPGFWVGNLVGLTSNIAFTLLVVLFVVFVDSDFSFIAWTKKVFGLH
jgi:hypothetical protein